MTFAREGARVLLVDAVLQRAEETLAMIVEEGGEASVFQADVTQRQRLPAHGGGRRRAVRPPGHPG